MIELKVCPFCGSTKLKIDSKRSNNFRHKDGKAQYSHVVTVRCNKCHADLKKLRDIQYKVDSALHDQQRRGHQKKQEVEH